MSRVLCRIVISSVGSGKPERDRAVDRRLRHEEVAVGETRPVSRAVDDNLGGIRPQRHPNEERPRPLNADRQRRVRVRRLDLDVGGLVVEQQVDPVARLVPPGDLSVRLAERADGAADYVHREANCRHPYRLVAVGRRGAEGAAHPLRHVAPAVDVVGVVRLRYPGDVAELGRQQMASQDALGVLIVLCAAPAAQDQRRLDDVSRVVGLPAIGVASLRIVFVGRGGGLDRPAGLVPDRPEAVVVETP